ncbi:hypothetical protein J6590_037162 [Homalodisca vitripennis]|nr:hypothetical protein J6590_037162 [Homalodisca vitripennis]
MYVPLTLIVPVISNLERTNKIQFPAVRSNIPVPSRPERMNKSLFPTVRSNSQLVIFSADNVIDADQSCTAFVYCIPRRRCSNGISRYLGRRFPTNDLVRRTERLRGLYKHRDRRRMGIQQFKQENVSEKGETWTKYKAESSGNSGRNISNKKHAAKTLIIINNSGMVTSWERWLKQFQCGLLSSCQHEVFTDSMAQQSDEENKYTLGPGVASLAAHVTSEHVSVLNINPNLISLILLANAADTGLAGRSLIHNRLLTDKTPSPPYFRTHNHQYPLISLTHSQTLY